MIVAGSIAACRKAMHDLQDNRGSVGLVPTMGALHRGHLSLIQAARTRCEAVAVTIFVNPTQFGPGEDFAAYPRPLDDDLRQCESAGVDLVFAPDVETIYPGGECTSVHVGGVTDVLCGPLRPGHFDGVATIVAKLFNILPADAAFFGEKDYQQLVVIRQLTRDLNIPIEIVGCPTLRESDGLAVSSRNAYLTPSQREQAAVLSRVMFAAAERAACGERDSSELMGAMRLEIANSGPAEIEYVDIVDAATLERMPIIDRPGRICLAVRIGSCRLIDNVAVDTPSKAD